MSDKIEIWGRTTSSNVQAVMWTIAELGLNHVRHDAGGAFGKTSEPDYRRMNPMGLVPAFKDGELTLFESSAIIRYLAAQYGDEHFWPVDPAKRASLDVWAEWTKTSVYPVFIRVVFWQLIRTKQSDRDDDAFANAVAETAELMKMFVDRLGDNDFLGGDRISFADISFGHLLYRYFELDFDRHNLPSLDAYYARLRNRLAYAENVMIDFSSLKVE